MPDEDLDNLEDDQQQGPKQLREALKREQQAAAQAQAELAQLKREAAFREAGVDLANPLHAAAVKGYDGSPEGIPEWVSGLGLNSPPPPPGIPPEEQAALERITAASRGDQPGIAPEGEQDKNRDLNDVYAQARREGWTTERFNEEMRQVVSKHGGSVMQMPYTVLPPEQQGAIR